MKMNIGERLRFVTAAELETATWLLSEHERIDSHFSDLTVDSLRRKYEGARDRYSREATDENFSALCEAAKNQAFFDQHDQIRTVVKYVMSDFVRTQIRPFFAALIERGRTVALQAVAAVEKEESARIKELTGQPLSGHSQVVEISKAPLHELEGLLARLRGYEEVVMYPPEIRSILGTLQNYAVAKNE